MTVILSFERAASEICGILNFTPQIKDDFSKRIWFDVLCALYSNTNSNRCRIRRAHSSYYRHNFSTSSLKVLCHEMNNFFEDLL
jgi:hypothetical protein